MNIKTTLFKIYRISEVKLVIPTYCAGIVALSARSGWLAYTHTLKHPNQAHLASKCAAAAVITTQVYLSPVILTASVITYLATETFQIYKSMDPLEASTLKLEIETSGMLLGAYLLDYLDPIWNRISHKVGLLISCVF